MKILDGRIEPELGDYVETDDAQYMIVGGIGIPENMAGHRPDADVHDVFKLKDVDNDVCAFLSKEGDRWVVR